MNFERPNENKVCWILTCNFHAMGVFNLPWKDSHWFWLRWWWFGLQLDSSHASHHCQWQFFQCRWWQPALSLCREENTHQDCVRFWPKWRPIHREAKWWVGWRFVGWIAILTSLYLWQRNRRIKIKSPGRAMILYPAPVKMPNIRYCKGDLLKIEWL